MDALITKEQVKHIADLCKLELTPDEITKFTDLFSDTLQYISKLDELDTTSVKGTYQVTGKVNEFAQDNKATLSKEEALSNAKEIKDGLFVTKGVLNK